MDAALHARDAAGIYDRGELLRFDSVLRSGGDEVIIVELATFLRDDRIPQQLIERVDYAAPKLLDRGERVDLAADVVSKHIDAESRGRLLGCEMPTFRGLRRDDLGYEVVERRPPFLEAGARSEWRRVERERIARIVRDDATDVSGVERIAQRDSGILRVSDFGWSSLLATRGEREGADDNSRSRDANRSVHVNLD
jgi:hypothetical protein